MTTEQTQPELNLNDIAVMRSVIDVVSQRGAFKASEMSAVGALYDKLNLFLEAHQQSQAEQTNSEQAGE